MAEHRCPVCNHENESSAIRCWYCQALLPDRYAGVGDEALSDERGETPTPETPSSDHTADERGSTESPQQTHQTDWRDKIRNQLLQDISDSSTDQYAKDENHAKSAPDGLHEDEEDTSEDASRHNEPYSEEDNAAHEAAKAEATGVIHLGDSLPDWLQVGEKLPLIARLGMNAESESMAPLSLAASANGAPNYAAQLTNAALFSRLPPEGVSASHMRARPGRHALGRIVIALILILAVLLPLLSQRFPLVIPAFYTQEVVDTLLVIEELSPDKPVLIAGQFEAGLAGELSWTFEAVASHLISRGVPLTLVSTNVAAHAILADTLSQAVGLATDYPPETKVVNLGYLPGGTVALSALVRDLPTAAPYTADLAPAWELPALANVRSLVDFGAILIVTDNPENVRAWVEQSGRLSSAPPLLVVSSAQAAPIIQPYYDSAQLAGFLSGAGGAATYQLLRQVAGKASNHYNAYQVVLLVSAILLVIGGMLALILPQHADKDQKRSR